jgi:hypothetical protein
MNPNDDPEVVQRLESLDDVMFPAIAGDQQALAQVEPAWRQTMAELGAAVVQESRNEYLRYARTTWEFLRGNTPGHRQQLLAILQIIALLTGVEM